MKASADKAAETAPANRKKRILLVEDDATSRLFLFNQLKKRGLEIDTASNGGIALKKLKGGDFDAVILDLMLPGMKGRDLIKEIRKKDAAFPIFVVTSAERMKPWRQRGAKAGATKVLDKSAPIEKIIGEIVGHLNPATKETSRAAERPQEDTTEEKTKSPPAEAVVPTPVVAAPAERPDQKGTIKPFHNPHAVPGTVSNTELMRKVADAGRAARGTPAPTVAAPTLLADTPLYIPELPEAPSEATVASIPQPFVSIPSAGNPGSDLPKEFEETAKPIIAPSKTSNSRHEIRELEEQLADLRRNRDELALLLRDRPLISSDSEPSAAIQETLDQAKAATSRAEAAYQAELTRSRQFEEELKLIRETRDELNRKLAEDEKAAAEARQRSKKLEERLAQSAAELEQSKAELQKSLTEHSALETELRSQISSARQSSDTTRLAYQEQVAQAQRLAEELESLRKTREDLNARLAAEMRAAEESKRRIEEREQQLREREAEVERLKAELTRRSSDNELSNKLSAAQVAAKNAQAIHEEESARGARLDEELVRLNEAREELNGRLAREEQAAAEARRRSEEMERELTTRNSELDRLKAELHNHAEERKALEQQLQQQVAKASDAADRVRRQFREETRIIPRSTEDVDALRRARDELNARLEREQQTAPESRRQSQEVESRLQATVQELANLGAELEKRTTGVSAPPAGIKDNPAPKPPPKQRPGLAARLMAPLKIFSSRPEERTIRDVEEQLAEVTRNRDELLVLLRDRPIFGLNSPAANKPEPLVETKAATVRAEAAYQAELARSRQFEEELRRIREARDELNRKLGEEEKAALESRRRSKELEDRLTQSIADVAHAKAELQKTVSNHSTLERDLRRQLDSTRQFADSTKLAYQKQAELRQRSVAELAALQNAREELNTRLSAEIQAAEESKRRSEEREQQLREKTAEVERLKTKLTSHADENLSGNLTSAERAAQNALAAYQEESARKAQFESELARLNHAREELNARLAREEQAAAEAERRSQEIEPLLAARTAELDRLKSELQRHAEERKVVEQQLQQQIARASDAAVRTRQEFEGETSFFHRSTEGVDALRRARDELNARFESEHRAATESRRHSEDLEAKLQASANELGHLRAELQKQSCHRADLVTAATRQLDVVKAAAAKAEKAYKEQLRRSAKFEKELAQLRQERARLGGKLKTGRKSSLKSNVEIQKLEKRAAAHAEELESTRAHFEQQVWERHRLESEQSALRQSQQTPGSENSSHRPAEARFLESISALARVTAELEKERGDRRRAEDRSAFLSKQLQFLNEELQKHLEIEKETQQRSSDIQQQLRERDTEVAKALADFQKEAAARELALAELKAKGHMSSQMQEQFDLLDDAKRVFNAAQEKLQARLEMVLADQKQTEAALQTQIAERKRLREMLDDVERKLQEQSQQGAAAIAALQSSLELETIERRKGKSQSLQSHYGSIDASRVGDAFVNSFRANLRPSADHILAQMRQLLASPLASKQKKRIEAALESALVLQTSMQEDAQLPWETLTEKAGKAA